MQLVNDLGYPLDKWISGWFRGADPSSIPEGNFKEFIAHMFYTKRTEELTLPEQAAVQRIYEDLCAKVGLSPRPGYDAEKRGVLYLFEPLEMGYRSLLSSVCTSFLPRALVHAAFLGLGLGHEVCPETGLGYWWRAPLTDAEVDEPDLLFFHGLCGYVGYVPLLSLLLRRPSRGAVLMELEDVSMSLNSDRWATRQAVVRTARLAFARLEEARGRPRRCLVVGHSMGSGPAAWVVQEPPCPVAASVFIDPIVFLVELPDLAYNFLYKVPQSLFEWLCFLHVSTETGVAYFFRRRFFWYHHRLDHRVTDTVPTLLCLSENDEIVPAKAIRQFAETHMKSVDLLWWRGLGHTYFMLSPKCHFDLVNWINKHSQTSDTKQ